MSSKMKIAKKCKSQLNGRVTITTRIYNELLKAAQGLTRSELAERLDIEPQVISMTCGYLIKQGVIQPNGFRSSNVHNSRGSMIFQVAERNAERIITVDAQGNVIQP